MIEKYFAEELHSLYDLGKEFAKAHPERAQFLNADRIVDRDPYVERLFEGFAFLTARIREKLDQSFPQLAEGLLQLMWPHFLQDIPSLTIVEFKPRIEQSTESVIIPRGTEIWARPAGKESTVCQFVTTSATVINPLTLSDVERGVDDRGNASLTFRFFIHSGVVWDRLVRKSIPVYLHCEMPTAFMLHEFLTTKAKKFTISLDDTYSVSVSPETYLSTGGLSPQHRLLPGNDRNVYGPSLLLEYFTFPEKFLFVNLGGGDQLRVNGYKPRECCYTISFEGDFPDDKPFTKECFRLMCTPAVNLFKSDIDPVACTGKQSSYRLNADMSYPTTKHVHSVVSVEGIDTDTLKKHTYHPRHEFRTSGTETGGQSFLLRYNPNITGRRDIHIETGGEQLRNDALSEQTLCINAWCHNGELPREELREGTIRYMDSDLKYCAGVHNISRPTSPISPPPQERLLPALLVHLGSTYTTLGTVDSLKSFLHLHNWRSTEGNRRRIEAITDVSVRSVYTKLHNACIPGVCYTISIVSDGFSDSGDIHLFCEVLKEFFSYTVPINTYLELECVQKPSEKVTRWRKIPL